MTELGVSVVATHVAICQIDEADGHNPLGPELMAALASALERLDRDREIRSIVLAGTEDAFATGADIRAGSEPGFERRAYQESALFWRRLGGIETPLIAAVSGWALGSGCELALASDMCVAAESAVFGQPEVTLGMIPGGGATQRLTRVLGKQRAMDLILTGRRWSAKQAREWGLVGHLSPQPTWLEEATDLAREVAARGPIATRLAKRAVLAADQLPLEEGLAAERGLFEETLATEDRIEGINALIQGREPDFKGR
jgi:enoyl-CoA hydratase